MEAALADCTSMVKRGISPRYSDAGALVVNQRCIRDGRLTLDDARRNDSQARRVPEDRWLQRWDVVVNSTGVGTLGRVAQVVDAPLEPTTVDSHVTIVRPDLASVDGRYFGFAMRLRQEQIEAMGAGATGQTELSRGRLASEVSIPLPSLPEQRKIAAVLAAYDDLIENNLRRIAILEEMAQAVYREWFVNFRFPGYKTVALVDSPLGLIPDGWQAGRFADIADLARKSVTPFAEPEEMFEHFSFAALDAGGVPSLQRGNSMKSAKLSLEQRSVLLAKLNPRIPRVWLANPRLGPRSVASSEFLVLQNRTPIPLVFIYAVCKAPEFLARLAGMASGTSTSHQRVKVDDLLNNPLAVPPQSILERFCDVVHRAYDLGETLVRSNVNLKAARDLLSPKLVSGEIDVSELNFDTEWMAA